ncbi:hypothetical protein Cpir12675_004492 [Ceratocystis pirilliformis]|uniref:Uncharacterized protein n=1 Tax=Ceratocystis pirilliformis TaxID=259994 RepID=A0ABR3YWC5_9PEZI
MARRFAFISALVVALSPSQASASTVFLADCGVGTVPNNPTWSTSREVYVYIDGNNDVKSPNTHAVVPWDNGAYPWRLSGVTVPFSDNTNWAFTINNDIFDYNYAGYGIHRDANGQRIESLYCYAHHDVDLGPSPSGSGKNCQSTFLCRSEAPAVPCPPTDATSQPTSYPVSPITPSYGVSRTSESTSNLGTSSFQPTGWSSLTSSLSSSTFWTSTLSSAGSSSSLPSLGTTSGGPSFTSIPPSSFWSTSPTVSTQSFSFTVNATTGFPPSTSGFGTGTGTGTATGTVPTGTSDPNPTGPASRFLTVKVEAHPRQVRVQRLWTAIVQKALVDIWGNCHSESIYLSDDTSIRYRCSGSNIEGYGRKIIVPVLIDALYRMGQERTWIVESNGYTTLPMAMSVLVSDGSSEAFVKYNLESPSFRYVGDQCVDCSQSESKFTSGWNSAAIDAFAPARPPISEIIVENSCNPESHCIQPDNEPTGAPPLWWW